jgi:hypothetical protein
VTNPAIPPKRGDELEPGMRVTVGRSTLSVAATRPGQQGDVEIRWEGSDLWASMPADRMFDEVVEVSVEAS